MIRRQEFQSIKTHEFVYQDASGRFPDMGSVMAVATDKGIARFTSDLSLNSLYVTSATIANITVGNQSASFIDLSATNASIHVLHVDSSATFLGNILYNSEVLAGNVDSTESFMVAVGNSSSGVASIRTSVNGIYWNNASGDLFTVTGYGVAWNGCLWVAVGSNGGNGNSNTIAYSSNGIDWAYATGGFLDSGRGVAWNGLYWIAVGTDAAPSGRTILISKDGISWSDANSTNLFQTHFPEGTGTGRSVAWNGQFWVVVGYDVVNQSNSTYVSKDGMNWVLGLMTVEAKNLFAPGGNSVAWGQTNWILVGDNTSSTNNYNIQQGTDNTIVYTPDNVSFADIEDGIFRGSSAIVGNGIAWNGSMWMIACAGNKGILYSSDVNGAANTWSVSPGMSSGTWNGITWNGSIWIAAGDDGVSTSHDGRTWLPTKGISGITYGVAARKILPNAGYILPKMIPASRNTVDANGMDLVFVSDPNVMKHSVVLLTVRIPRSITYPTNAPAVPYNQGRAYVYRKEVGSGFYITSYEYDSSTYDYAIIN